MFCQKKSIHPWPFGLYLKPVENSRKGCAPFSLEPSVRDGGVEFNSHGGRWTIGWVEKPPPKKNSQVATVFFSLKGSCRLSLMPSFTPAFQIRGVVVGFGGTDLEPGSWCIPPIWHTCFKCWKALSCYQVLKSNKSQWDVETMTLQHCVATWSNPLKKSKSH